MITEHTWGSDGFCIYCNNVHRTDNNAKSTCSNGFKCSVEYVWYVVVYRIGGTLRFSWKHTLPVSYDKAKEQEKDLRRQGYYCYVQNYNVIKEHGLPMTYDEDTHAVRITST